MRRENELTDPEIEAPSVEELDRVRAEADAEDGYFHEHFDELYRTYPEQFIAVKDGEVLTTDPSLFDFCAQLEARGIRPYDVWTTFLTKRGAKLTL